MTKLALIQPSKVKDWERNFLRRVQSDLSQQGPDSQFQLVPTVEEADVVLYVDSNESTRDLTVYRKLLEQADKEGKFVFALSFEDQPLGALPGIYTSLVPGNFDSTLHLSWPHLEPPNSDVESTTITPAKEATKLFTFSGSCSHRLRRKLFSIFERGQSDRWKVVEIKRWYDHTDDEHKDYVNDILDSHFVLCPRGIAAYSHRIFEAMLLERVPVIIADDWVPFSFPEQNYYITIPENELEEIAYHLERELENYDSYLSNVLATKSNWLADDSRYAKIVGHFLEFHQQNPAAHEPKVLLERLKSHEFLNGNGLLSHQKLFALANAVPRCGMKVFEKFAAIFFRNRATSATEATDH